MCRPRHRALAEQRVGVSENRGLERNYLEGDDLLLPEFDLPLAGGGKFAAGDQQPVALGENLRRQGGGRHRQDVDAMTLAGTFERLKPDFAGVGQVPAGDQKVIPRAPSYRLQGKMRYRR